MESIGRTVIRPAAIPHKIIGALMILLSLLYLMYFVPRGWVAHDEGMRGQAAERVLAGGLPHVDYGDLYTGGLAELHAAVFRIAGIDLIHLRWILFAGACLAQWITYALLRRYLSPIAAALMTWVALAWSFPNFFTPEASWWLLICGLCCLWAFVRYVETDTIWYAAAAGLAVGFAILVKQMGVYLLVALLLSMLWEPGNDSPVSRSDRLLRGGVALGALLLALAILRPRLALAEMLYLLLPIAACSRLLFSSGGAGRRHHQNLLAVAVASSLAALPFACFLIPYIVHHHLWSLVNGLVILPQKHFVFTSIDMPSAGFILTGLPLVALVVPFARSTRWPASRSPFVVAGVACGILVPLLLVASLHSSTAYQGIWQSSRAFVALLPVAICWCLISGRVEDVRQQRILFASSAMLAWASLNQFPFSAPIYFCYVTPLAVFTGVAAAHQSSKSLRPVLGAWMALLLAFAVASMNRGYIYNLGQAHEPDAFNVDLNLPRAHLRVTARDALVYRRLTALVSGHLGDGRLMAGPDCPEVYFLLGRFNPSGALFDFLSDKPAGTEGLADTAQWDGTSVIVINHQPSFSPRPSPSLTSEIRRAFPAGESTGEFEVRWR
jgi:Dolichyl-phosphate-mannose-protein mannosyltransferase